MNKSLVVVSCPIDTYSGYGARARDFVKALLKLDQYEVQILSQRWGNTRFGYLEDHNESELQSLIIPSLKRQPEIWVQVTVPNEFQKVGKYNIGLTAGIETTVCAPTWIQGCNRMDLIITSSEHSKKIFESSKFNQEDVNTKQIISKIELTTKVEVLMEGGDISKYFPTSTFNNLELKNSLDNIKESFCFLFVGHWLPGDLGQDRKNVGYTIKSFLETFKNKLNQPALILKTSKNTASIIDREGILDEIERIKSTVKGKLPSVYLLHGDLKDQEINELYNHPKVKAMVSLTKGEGFGRPLLEFSFTGKPILASGWSGQTDFLKPDLSYLVGGQLTKVDKSAAVKDIILEDSSWFTPDDAQVGKYFKEIYKNYKVALNTRGKQQGRYSKKHFSFDEMTKVLKTILDNNLPEFPKMVTLNLPKLQTNG
jgi:glycosyltransferase involved in cell wall biosynthesis